MRADGIMNKLELLSMEKYRIYVNDEDSNVPFGTQGLLKEEKENTIIIEPLNKFAGNDIEVQGVKDEFITGRMFITTLFYTGELSYIFDLISDTY